MATRPDKSPVAARRAADGTATEHLPFAPDIRPLSARYTTAFSGAVEARFFQNLPDVIMRN